MANKRNPFKKPIDGKSLKELREYFEEKKNTELEQYYNNIRKLIDKQYSKSLKVSSVVNMAKYHREIFDFEILCDCIIDVIGPINQTESMMKWDPLPFNDEGTRYRLYRNYRFNKITGISQDVSDDIIIELLKGDTATKPQTKAVEKEEDKTSKELINVEKSKKWTYQGDFKLCERLSNNEYLPTPEEKLRMKDKTFQSNRTKWWDRPERKYRDKFVNIIEELASQTQMEVTKFSVILNVNSDYHRDALLNAFKYAVNHPDGSLYEKENKKKASIQNTRKGKILLLK